MSSYHSAATLPAPDADAIAHSERLIGRIVECIEKSGGVLPFDAYMQACLYEPGLGYYSAGAVKFGAEGDFVTAPEISPLFGRTLAHHAAALFRQGLAPALLEFGAGSGRLCRDLLLELDRLDAMPDRYAILEPSPDLRQRQQALLAEHLPPGLFERIAWLDALPQGFNGLVLGNEVLDAMPVKVLHKQGDWRELGVALEQGRFVWKPLPPQMASAALLEQIRRIDGRYGLPEGYATEINPNYEPWLRALSGAGEALAVLLIDYGYPESLYYHPSRASGTLQCFYRHRVHGDPFVYPGLQDITAFVDFDALARAAGEVGFEVAGIVRQADFLLGNGLLELSTAGVDALARLQFAQQVKTLTLPTEMGEKFKCLALARGIDLDFPGLRLGINPQSIVHG